MMCIVLLISFPRVLPSQANRSPKKMSQKSASNSPYTLELLHRDCTRRLAIIGYNYDDAERAAEAAKFAISAHAVPRLVRLLSEGIGSQTLKRISKPSSGRSVLSRVY